jgi:hypothetical protein
LGYVYLLFKVELGLLVELIAEFSNRLYFSSSFPFSFAGSFVSGVPANKAKSNEIYSKSLI